jgi:hypothetical protein
MIRAAADPSEKVAFQQWLARVVPIAPRSQASMTAIRDTMRTGISVNNGSQK